jgi:hypothetical protein
VRNDLFFAPGKQSIYANEHSTYSADGNIDDGRDPGFVDATPGVNDFHLSPGSPAIDAGLDLSALGLITDLDGTKRPHGDGYDIGPYEACEP